MDVRKHNAEADEMARAGKRIERAVHTCMGELDHLDGEQRRQVLRRLMIVYGERQLTAP